MRRHSKGVTMWVSRLTSTAPALRRAFVFDESILRVYNRAMKVDRKQFEAVVGNLLRTPPVPRSEAKTGQPKTGKIIPAKR